MLAESFWTLLKDPGHWLFEGFVTLVLDVVVGYLVIRKWYPKIKKKWQAEIRAEEHEIHGIDVHEHEDRAE